jgi:hypothetical protein
LGIIDYPETYSKKKQAERMLKLAKHPSQDPSTAPPLYYADRFLDYVDKIIPYNKNRGY